MLPPTSSVLRARYPALLRAQPELVPTAYALDSVLTELLFVAGPLIVALLVAALSPQAALAVSAVSVVAGTGLFVALLGAPESPPTGVRARPGGLGALRSAGLRTVAVATLPVGFALGSIEVALPAFAAEEQVPGLAGVLLAAWSIGSAAGGVVYGVRPRAGSLTQAHLRLAVLVPLSFLPLVLAPSVALMAPLAVGAGLFIAPLLASRNELARVAAPAGSETEAVTWPLTAMLAGIAAGAAVAGALVEAADWRIAVLAGAGVAGVGALLALARRGSLPEAAAA